MTTTTKTLTPVARRVLVGVSACLALVILAPIVLSGQDLFAWARSTRGLDLAPWFALMVPVALDIAAAACIGMVVIGAVWRRERPGIFGVLVWVFAGVSAWAQYRHGMSERLTGRAQDAFWLFPALALLGPTLLEVTLNRVRRWARQDVGEQHTGAAGFGARWLPGVAFRETLAAWAASRREGIADWRDAVTYVRERSALAALSGPDAIRYAYGALGHADPHTARVWLQVRGVLVDQADIDAVSVPVPTDVTPVELPVEPAPVPSAPAPAEPTQVAQTSTHTAAEPVLVPAPPAPGNKLEAIRTALDLLGCDTSAARVVSHLAEHGVTVSESFVRKTRRQLAEAAVSLPTRLDPTSQHAPKSAPATPINGRRPALAAVPS